MRPVHSRALSVSVSSPTTPSPRWTLMSSFMVMVLGPGNLPNLSSLREPGSLTTAQPRGSCVPAYSQTVDYAKPIPSWALVGDADPSTWQSCKIPGWRVMALLENPMCVWMGGVVGPSHASSDLGQGEEWRSESERVQVRPWVWRISRRQATARVPACKTCRLFLRRVITSNSLIRGSWLVL